MDRTGRGTLRPGDAAGHGAGDGSTTAAAQAIDAVKVYGTAHTQVTALDHVNVAFAKGAFTAIMGRSGSGKSTLMHCLAGLDTLTSGRILIGDTDLTSLDDKHLTQLRRDRIGFVFQSFNLVPTLTAAENIALPAALAGRRSDQTWVDTVVIDAAIRAAGPPRVPPGRAVGWAATTGGSRSGAGVSTGDCFRRRTNRQP